MPYTLIKGQFHLYYRSQRLVGSRPDGDSMWFKPDKKNTLAKLGGRRVEFNGGGCAQLRFEGIDALELHYKGSNHQRAPECVDARNRLLQSVGFTSVTYAPSSKVATAVRTASPHPIEGYILSRSVDPFGRPVAFVFAGTTSERDGAKDIWLTPERVAQSLNGRLMAEGQAYPAYYSGLPSNLRNQLTTLANSARNHGLGIWREDVSLSGARVVRASDLEQYAMWPKLYRRLFAYFADGNSGISGFGAWLRGDSSRDDELWIISRGELGNMHDIVSATDVEIQLVVHPEDVIIVPR
ncbi:MAG: hypothetical protein JSW54_01995 [Fidelibacterota bacterium]|nr:MAG: hypothetical protein JSW54_01995 [Candidatus Neomarinimicrobiota bacterium]